MSGAAPEPSEGSAPQITLATFQQEHFNVANLVTGLMEADVAKAKQEGGG